ncbi:MAG: FlgD immunoglobulin-like domain containing protein, partial [bacterium]
VDYSPWQDEGVQDMLLGDVSLNQEITAYDASLILRTVIGGLTLTAWQEQLGDVTCQGGLSALDAAYVLRFVAGLTTFFPCEAESIVTKDTGTYPGLARGDYRIDLVALPSDPQGQQRLEVRWGGTGDVLSAQFTLRVQDGVRITAVEAGAELVGAQFQTRVSEPGLMAVALAAPEGLPEGVLFTLDLDLGGTHSAAAPITFVSALLNEQNVLDDMDRQSGNLVGPLLVAQNQPNPFNPITTIRFRVPGNGGDRVATSLKIYDLAGRLVRTLVQDDLAARDHEYLWNGRNDSGARVVSGVYVYRVVAGGAAASRKMTLLK